MLPDWLDKLAKGLPDSCKPEVVPAPRGNGLGASWADDGACPPFTPDPKACPPAPAPPADAGVDTVANAGLPWAGWLALDGVPDDCVTAESPVPVPNSGAGPAPGAVPVPGKAPGERTADMKGDDMGLLLKGLCTEALKGDDVAALLNAAIPPAGGDTARAGGDAAETRAGAGTEPAMPDATEAVDSEPARGAVALGFLLPFTFLPLPVPVFPALDWVPPS